MKMNKTSLLLGLGVLMMGIGIFGTRLGSIITPNGNNPNVTISIEEPSDKTLLKLVQPVISAWESGPADTRFRDASRLASLYLDIATLIELEGDNLCIKNTEEIREANKLSGNMLKLQLRDKYPDLKEACNSFVVASIGEENILLTTELRQRSTSVFRALAWACQQGAN